VAGYWDWPTVSFVRLAVRQFGVGPESADGTGFQKVEIERKKIKRSTWK
jgi:hypothetical protein